MKSRRVKLIFDSFFSPSNLRVAPISADQFNGMKFFASKSSRAGLRANNFSITHQEIISCYDFDRHPPLKVLIECLRNDSEVSPRNTKKHKKEPPSRCLGQSNTKTDVEELCIVDFLR